jgi:hypothetical protein
MLLTAFGAWHAIRIESASSSCAALCWQLGVWPSTRLGGFSRQRFINPEDGRIGIRRSGLISMLDGSYKRSPAASIRTIP